MFVQISFDKTWLNTLGFESDRGHIHLPDQMSFIPFAQNVFPMMRIFRYLCMSTLTDTIVDRSCYHAHRKIAPFLVNASASKAWHEN